MGRLGNSLFQVRKRVGLTTEHQEALRSVDELEQMIRAQAQTAKEFRPRYTTKRKKAETARQAAEARLRKADSPERRAELENKIERMDRRVRKASERVQGLDARAATAAEALDDLDILRMDIRLADNMEDIDYLETVQDLKTKVTQDGLDEAMPAASFKSVCDEISSLAQETSEQQHSFINEDIVGADWNEADDVDEAQAEAEVSNEEAI